MWQVPPPPEEWQRITDEGTVTLSSSRWRSGVWCSSMASGHRVEEVRGWGSARWPMTECHMMVSVCQGHKHQQRPILYFFFLCAFSLRLSVSFSSSWLSLDFRMSASCVQCSFYFIKTKKNETFMMQFWNTVNTYFNCQNVNQFILIINQL